jgi:AhpD family alkylhydroperoxidase
MTPRINIGRYLASGPLQTLIRLGQEAEQGGIDQKIYELVKIRASQINGCAYCLDMHTKDTRAAGETEQRIYALNAWREAPFFSDRERAALEWTEAVTRLPNQEVPDETYDRVRQQFDEKEIVSLTFAIAAINSFNRVNIAFRTVSGSYQPKAHAQHA